MSDLRRLLAEIKSAVMADGFGKNKDEAAVRRARGDRRGLEDFDARAEQAWMEFQRTGQAVPASEVLDMLQARLEAKRRSLSQKERLP